jgi:hypothetical protein
MGCSSAGARDAPHCPQNLESGGLSNLDFGQCRFRDAPHRLQNF